MRHQPLCRSQIQWQTAKATPWNGTQVLPSFAKWKLGRRTRENKLTEVLNPTPGTHLFNNYHSPYSHLWLPGSGCHIEIVKIKMTSSLKYKSSYQVVLRKGILILTSYETLTHNIFQTMKDCNPVMNETTYLYFQIKNVLSVPPSLKHIHIFKFDFSLVNFTCVLMVLKPLIKSEGRFQSSII